jgi:hypothetical protein
MTHDHFSLRLTTKNHVGRLEFNRPIERGACPASEACLLSLYPERSQAA